MLSVGCRLWLPILPLLLIVAIGSTHHRLVWRSLDTDPFRTSSNASRPAALAAQRMDGGWQWRRLGRLRSWTSSQGSDADDGCACARIDTLSAPSLGYSRRMLNPQASN